MTVEDNVVFLKPMDGRKARDSAGVYVNGQFARMYPSTHPIVIYTKNLHRYHNDARKGNYETLDETTQHYLEGLSVQANRDAGAQWVTDVIAFVLEDINLIDGLTHPVV